MKHSFRALALAGALLLSACGGRDEGGQTANYDMDLTGRAPEDGDWLVAVLDAEMESLNPYTSTDVYSSYISAFLFDTLLQYDNATLDLKAKLAESWEASEDHLSYTFQLRQDAVFSDGKPVTAEDVKFSFDTIKSPTTDAPHMRNYYQDVTACEIVDARTIRFTCDKPYFKHAIILGLMEIIPKHIYGVGDFNKHPNNRNPIGSGPYVMERWETNQQLVLVRNEQYWGEKPHILRYVFKIITNEDAALQVMMRQELDMSGLRGLLPEQWINQANTPQFEAHFNKITYPAARYYYVGWNCRRPQFEDKMVRRALTMLLDRELLVKEVMHGLATVTASTFLPSEPEFNPSIEPWPYDPKQAATLLDQASWVDSNGNGLRDKNGLEFRFEVALTPDSPTAERLATIYQEQLAAAGIEMTIRQLEWASLLESVHELEFDATLMGWGMVPYPDPYQLWHSSQTVKRGSNHVGFVNAEADAIMEAARLEFDRDARSKMYQRLQEIIHEEQPVTFTYIPEQLMAVHRRFQNVKVYPYGTDSMEWWVPQELQRYP